jgi:hypothetical protein
MTLPVVKGRIFEMKVVCQNCGKEVIVNGLGRKVKNIPD